MKQKPQATVYKTILQVGYAPNPAFLSRLGATAGGIPGYSKDTFRLGPGHVIVQDVEHHCSLNVGANVFTYEQDSGDEELETRNIKAAAAGVTEGLPVNSFLRFDLRRHYVVPVDSLGMSFESLVQVMNLKFSSDKENLRSFLPKLTDLRWQFFATEPPYKYDITIGPMEQNQLRQVLAFNQDSHLADETKVRDYAAIVAAYPKTLMYLNMDIAHQAEDSSQRFTIAELDSFLQAAPQKLTDLSTHFTSYVFSPS